VVVQDDHQPLAPQGVDDLVHHLDWRQPLELGVGGDRDRGHRGGGLDHLQRERQPHRVEAQPGDDPGDVVEVGELQPRGHIVQLLEAVPVHARQLDARALGVEDPAALGVERDGGEQGEGIREAGVAGGVGRAVAAGIAVGVGVDRRGLSEGRSESRPESVSPAGEESAAGEESFGAGGALG